MKKALYPGTFDPPTLGHLDIIERAAKLCDELFIGIAQNTSKPDTFSIDERKALLKEMTKDLSNIKIVTISELVVNFAKQNKIDVLIRGLRTFTDFEYEYRMAQANKSMTGIETLFLFADARFAHISSSLIRELAFFGSHLNDFIPSSIEKKVFERLKSKK